MSTRKTLPVGPQSANLTAEQMRSAIPKLQRRIDELNEFDVSLVRDSEDPRTSALRQKMDDTLVEIFGVGSIEYDRYKVWTLRDQMAIPRGGLSPQQNVEAYRRGFEKAKSNLRTAIELLEEKLHDGCETPSGRAARAFGDLDLHPEIEKAAEQLFRDEHYTAAVEAACKVLDAWVKLRSGRDDLSGTELMQTVFSPKSPTLKFNEQQNDSEKSEQQGMMFLYMGAMLAIRNPRAHGLITDHPEQAVEYLGFLSMLTKATDRAKKA